ncbi:MAG TPA: YdeI/OmpD-associated family protein [Acidobacteriaceae bacterium]|nr:YdeI/OmpD-associated family protein [Acidobacteriaceae bacterium]
MEGERIAPPILEAAFVRQPRARVAWQALTPVQRRGHLLAFFIIRARNHGKRGRKRRSRRPCSWQRSEKNRARTEQGGGSWPGASREGSIDT